MGLRCGRPQYPNPSRRIILPLLSTGTQKETTRPPGRPRHYSVK
jgi:hypothetical protein